jgi:HD superfamily phosphohydrolase
MLDRPVLQRLLGIRQLGMAHAVYTSAVHDRLSHRLGVVEIASRMIQALERNAHYRRTYGSRPDADLPFVSDHDRFSIRLAALLHDIGHAPFSHATESLVKERAHGEMETIFDLLRSEFEGAQQIKPSEAIAVLVVLGDAPWQARRYSMAMNRRVSFVLIAYKPASEAALLSLPSRVSVMPLQNSPETCAVVRLLVPWGVKIPSRAKAA